MPIHPFIITAWARVLDHAQAASDRLYEVCNGLVGRSWLFDNLVSLAQQNVLVKAAVLGGCFIAAWHLQRNDETTRRDRRVLMVTLFAALVVAGTTKSLSNSIFLPRPFVQSQAIYYVQGEHLVESKPLPYRVPLDDYHRKVYQDLKKGDVIQNDLVSFPSDHAGFYFTLALGILLVSRPIGWIAMGWTCIVLLASRVITGQHSPLDVVAGSAIGAAVLLVALFVARLLRWPLDQIAGWTIRHQALATVLVFVAVFEASNTLQDLPPLIETCSAIADHLFKG
ncbi:MAG TPA: phosphatase PAP2 family protein [Candidatus Krumholzibacteria bacterium]